MWRTDAKSIIRDYSGYELCQWETTLRLSLAEPIPQIIPVWYRYFLNVAPVGSEGEFYMNYALQRPATQSSTFAPDFVANNSVDGVINGNPSVTAPNDQDPWWKVQLANRIWVSQVELTCLYCEWIACHTDITPLTQSFLFLNNPMGCIQDWKYTFFLKIPHCGILIYIVHL